MGPEISYTFVCLASNQVAVHLDVQTLPEGAQRTHALQLLRDHASSASVEVWRGEAVIEVVARNGVRPTASSANSRA